MPPSSRLLQDMSSRRLEGVFSVTIFRLPRRLEDLSKTSSRGLAKGLENVFKTSSRRLKRRKIVTLKTCWRRHQDMSWGPTNVCWVLITILLCKASGYNRRRSSSLGIYKSSCRFTWFIWFIWRYLWNRRKFFLVFLVLFFE